LRLSWACEGQEMALMKRIAVRFLAEFSMAMLVSHTAFICIDNIDGQRLNAD